MNTIGKKTFTFILILVCVGVVLSLVLAQEHYIAPLVKSSGKTFNAIDNFARMVCGSGSSVISCSKVASSKYAVLAGVPVAIYGFIFFLFAAFFACFLYMSDEKIQKGFTSIFFWLIAAGSLYDVILFAISIFKIKALCTFCVGTYLCLWGILGLLIYYYRKIKEKPLNPVAAVRAILAAVPSQALMRICAVFCAAVILSGGVGYGVNRYFKYKKDAFTAEIRAQKIEKIVEDFQEVKPVEIQVSQAQLIGKPSAPITIIKFSDFMCPSCLHASQVLNSVVQENPDKVKVYFMNFPLDINCNSIMESQLHEGSCYLSKGAICASFFKKFREYYELVFRLQWKSPGIVELRELARQVSIDPSLFEQRLYSPATTAELNRQINEGIKFGVDSTPSIFINGRMYRYKVNREILDKLIEQELKVISQ